MQNVRIIEIPKCKMVSSGTGLFGQEKFDLFCNWFSHIDQRTDMAAMKIEVNHFLTGNGLCRDSSRYELDHIITSPTVQQILGYCQMDYYTPVKK